MARIQITDLNSSDSELSYELSEQELQSVVGGDTPILRGSTPDGYPDAGAVLGYGQGNYPPYHYRPILLAI